MSFEAVGSIIVVPASSPLTAYWSTSGILVHDVGQRYCDTCLVERCSAHLDAGPCGSCGDPPLAPESASDPIV